jgi:hypothetical protein
MGDGCGSSDEPDLPSPKPLHNALPPNVTIKRENPTHRLICFLKAQGKSNREIAKRTEKTEPWISQVVRQPWARELILEEITGSGKAALDVIFESEATNSAFTLIEIRDDVGMKGATRAAAANSLLDRFLGKPVTKNLNLHGKLTAEDELNNIDKELQELEEEEARLRGGRVLDVKI